MRWVDLDDKSIAVEIIDDSYLENLLPLVGSFVSKVGEEYIRSIFIRFDEEWNCWICDVYYFLTDKK